jgi:hypothetical protein
MPTYLARLTRNSLGSGKIHLRKQAVEAFLEAGFSFPSDVELDMAPGSITIKSPKIGQF